MRRAMPFASAATRASFAARGRGRSTISSCRIAPRARPHEDDAIGEAHGLADVVRDEDDRLARGAPDALDLALQDLARLRVERGERLVHQQHGGIGRQRARDGAALAHAARELVRVAVLEAPEVHRAAAAPRCARLARAAPSPWSLSGNSTLSRSVSHGKSAASWKTTRAIGPGAGRRATSPCAAPAPTSAARDRRPGSGSWTCRCPKARAGRRTRRPRRAGEAPRRISTVAAPVRRRVSETSSRATLAPARGEALTHAGARERPRRPSTHAFAIANTRLL